MKQKTLFGCDGYNHTFPPFQQLVKGNYLELHKDQEDNDVYYIDYGKRAIVSYFGVLGIILHVEILHEMKYVKLPPVCVISSNIHQALCGLFYV